MFPRTRLTALLLASAPFFVVASNSPVSAQILTVDQLQSCVVYLQHEVIETRVVQGRPYEVWLREPGTQTVKPSPQKKFGTGFLVARTPELYLVTASHVATFLTPGSTATLGGQAGNPKTIRLRDLAGSSDSLTWTSHRDHDIAVLRLHPSAELLTGPLAGHFFPFELLIADEVAPARDTQITVIGFPAGLGTEKHFSPLTLQTFPASALLELENPLNAKMCNYFALQDPSIGGYSGAPAFDVSIRSLTGGIETRGRGTRCYGLVQGTYSGSLTIVIPSSYIVTTIESSNTAAQ